MSKIYLLKREEAARGGWDTFDSLVVVADSEDEARLIHPEESWCYSSRADLWEDNSYTWVNTPEEVIVAEVGEANDNQEAGTIVCASFNAG